MATKITTMGNLIDYTNTITDSDKKTKAQKYLRSRFHSFVKEHPEIPSMMDITAMMDFRNRDADADAISIVMMGISEEDCTTATNEMAKG